MQSALQQIAFTGIHSRGVLFLLALVHVVSAPQGMNRVLCPLHDCVATALVTVTAQVLNSAHSAISAYNV